ncbi:MAG: HPr-rel-A system PqqD family peptide chaperone [Gammaproteobacteria bacterium]|nr:HPr-rel-A system PqqD family peptide chaperone [Gammaproteobacteria bacterium]
MSLFWTAVNADVLRWVAWEADNAVFDGETGETHLLSELPALLIHTLAAGPQDVEALSALTAAECDTALNDAWRDKIHRLLIDLAHLELVEQTAPAGP